MRLWELSVAQVLLILGGILALGMVAALSASFRRRSKPRPTVIGRPPSESAGPHPPPPAAPAPAARSRPRSRTVWQSDEPRAASLADVTVYAPMRIAPADDVLVQVYIHPPEAVDEVAQLAQAADPDSSRRAGVSIPDETAHGSRVEIRLEAPGFSIDEPIQYLIWRGSTDVVFFACRAGRDTVLIRVRILIDGVPRRTAAFKMSVVQEGDRSKPVAIGAKAYQSAFLSYASADRSRVLEHYQSLRAVGLNVFQDILDLDPGSRWEKELQNRIAGSDVFLLYWSAAAAASQWVVKEAEWAMVAQQSSAHGMPDIIPVLLEGPPPPAPPPSLAEIHFNDPVRYIIAAQRQSEIDKRKE